MLAKILNGIKALGNGLRITFINNFRKPVTYQYKYAPRWSKESERPIAPRYRGRFVLVREPKTGELRCTGCGTCARACPGKCIAVTAENKKVSTFELDMPKCLFCGLCVESCPFEALGMKNEPVLITRGRKSLVLDLAALAQQDEAMPGVMPSTVAGDLRPGKQPFVPKVKAAEPPAVTE